MDDQQLPDSAPEQAVDTPVTPAEGTVEAGTTEQQAAETDERSGLTDQQKAQRARDKLQRRFGELKAKMDQKDSQIDQLLEVVQQRGAAQSAPQPVHDADRMPQRTDPGLEDYETFLEAKAAWRAQQVARREIEQDRRVSAQQSARWHAEKQAYEAVNSFAQSQEAFAKSTPDYYEALDNSTAQLPDGIEQVFVSVPDSHIAAYAIAKNPELAQQFWGKSQIQQAAVLGSIVAGYKARPAPQVSTAPPPGRPVSPRGAAASSLPSDSDSADEWLRKRRAQLKARDG